VYAKEVNAQSPLRILERSIHGGLGKGNLGVVMARAGVGKTAAIVQIGLDDLMRDRPVLHVTLDQTVDHVQSWYDALFDDMAGATSLEARDVVAHTVASKRRIASFRDHDLWPERLQKTVEMFRETMDFRPAAVLVDGFDWTAHTVAETAAMLGAFKSYAKLIDAELWMTAQTHREVTGSHPTRLTEPVAEYESLIDVALFLEPHDHVVSLRLLKDHDEEVVEDTHLLLYPETLRLATEDTDRPAVSLPNSVFTVLSGGAPGAEEVFGQCAEKWGVSELNFTFEGRQTRRTRGLVRLTPSELDEGAVHKMYIENQMHRDYPQAPNFQKVLQSIWHQVQTAGEVFAIGRINDDDTVKGGTGWAAELAKHWHKPVHVFDQDRSLWFAWDHDQWRKLDEAPLIRSKRFTGTGTRELNDAGRRAIESLFERSFGEMP